MDIAIVAISLPGSRLAARLHDRLPEAALFLPCRHAHLRPEAARPFDGPAAGLLRDLFGRYRGLVVFGSVGMVARLVAPLLQDKRSDPAVVVVDDGGRFAVSLLSGHLGGANPLARQVAGLLGAQPVITTASDALGLPAVDLLGAELGWRIEEGSAMTRVSAALVDGEPVGVVQEAGEPDWWPEGTAIPSNLMRFAGLEELTKAGCAAALVITDRLLGGWADRLPPTVTYRPRSLVAGVGCNRGSSAQEIKAALISAFRANGLALGSLAGLASVEIKRDEEGLVECAGELETPLHFFSVEQLDGVSNLPNQSSTVRRWIGAGGVCEPAALLGAGGGELLVPKVKSTNVTVAIARIAHSRRAEGL